MQSSRLASAIPSNQSLRLDDSGQPRLQPLLIVPADLRLVSDQELLIWNEAPANDTAYPATLVAPNRKMLEQFIRLRNDHQGKDILKFARHWGVLHLCEQHQLPISHNEQYLDMKEVPPCTVTRYDRQHGEVAHHGLVDTIRDVLEPTHHHHQEGDNIADWRCESLERWRQLATQADTLRNAAAELHANSVASPAQWMLLLKHGLLHSIPTGSTPTKYADDLCRSPIPLQRERLAEALDVWLRWGAVRPRLLWSPQGESQSKDWPPVGNGLFGILAYYLLTSIVRELYRLVRCSSCTSWFEIRAVGISEAQTHDELKVGRNRYCQQCGRKAANRDAQRRHRRGESKPRKPKAVVVATATTDTP